MLISVLRHPSMATDMEAKVVLVIVVAIVFLMVEMLVSNRNVWRMDVFPLWIVVS